MTPTVLIVEDDPSTRGAMQDLLEDGGYDVITAAHGREALDHLSGRATPVSLIVLDWLMPVMGGSDFLARLAVDPINAGTPVVVLSAHDRVLSGHGVTAVVSKPVRTRTLLEVIGRLVGMPPRRTAPASPTADTQPMRAIARTVAFRHRRG